MQQRTSLFAQPGHERRQGLGGSLSILTLALGLALAAAPTQPQAQVTAIPVSLSAQSLSSALLRLGEQAGLQIVFLPDTVRGLNAPAVSGQYTPDQALRLLLAGTGIDFRREGNRVSLSRPAAAGSSVAGDATMLAPVLIRGNTGAVTEGTGAYTATGPSGMSTGLGLSLRETPQSVSVITSQRMKDQNLTQLTDVANQTAGLVVNQGANVGSDSSSIYSRGFAIDTYMVDGVKLSSPYASIFQSQDMALYDRVEVLRGSSGLMNGIGSPGGAINLIRKRPFDDFRTEITLEGGSWGHKRGLFDLSTPLNSDGSVRGRMVAMVQDSNSYIERFNDKRKVFYGVIEADLGESTQLRGGVSHQRHDLTGHARSGLPAYADDGSRMIWSRSASAGANWAYSRRYSTSMFAELDHRFANDWKVQFNATRTITESDELVGYASGGNPNHLTGKGVQIWATRWQYKPTQDSFSLTASGQFTMFGRQHDAAFGGSLSRSRFISPSHTDWNHPGWSSAVPNIFNWDGSTPPPPPNPAIGTHGTDERNDGAYLSLRFRPTDQLSLIMGSRYVGWSREQATFRHATQRSTFLRRTERKLVPYAALTYDFLENWTAYISYTSIFVPQNNKRPDGSYIDPLSGQSYEAGIKAAFMDGRLNLGASVYQLKENNKAIALPNVFAPDGSQAYEAKSGTRTRGFEIEASGTILPGWELAASFAHNRTQDRDGIRINTAVPMNVAKLFTSYRIDGIGDGLTLGGGIRWQSAIYSENMGPKRERFTQPAYAVVDLMGRYDINKHLSASLNIHNLFDKHYYTSTGNSYYGRPRTFMLSLTGRF